VGNLYIKRIKPARRKLGTMPNQLPGVGFQVSGVREKKQRIQ
jgi:hypothetical protein